MSRKGVDGGDIRILRAADGRAPAIAGLVKTVTRLTRKVGLFLWQAGGNSSAGTWINAAREAITMTMWNQLLAVFDQRFNPLAGSQLRRVKPLGCSHHRVPNSIDEGQYYSWTGSTSGDIQRVPPLLP
jgi:hypothetical protein